MIKKNNNRILWIDNLKGFILLMVCLSHLEIFKDFHDFLRPARMTTFFFISGYLFSTKQHSTINSYIKNKFSFLLFPYYKLCFLFALIPLYLHHNNYTHGVVSKIQQMLEYAQLPQNVISYILTFYSNIINALSGFPQVGPLWFVFTLFQVSCIFYVFYYFANQRRYNFILLTIFTIISITGGWYCNIHNISLPLHMHTMFTALFFFSLGVLLKKTVNNHISNKFSHKNILILCATTLLYIFTNNTYDSFGIHSNKLGVSFLHFLTTTISGIISLIIIFKIISSQDKYNLFGIFRNIARNALIILPMHYYLKNLCDVVYDNHNSSVYLYTRLLIVILGTIISIIIFRNKLYWFIGKEKISIKESLSLS